MHNKYSHIRSLFFFPIVLILAILACQTPGSSASAPTITMLSPPQGTQINLGDTVEVTYRAEDSQGITRVVMSVDENPVDFQDAPVPEGQTPLEGILRWTPDTAGSYNLLLIAYNAEDTASSPAGVSIIVMEQQAVQLQPSEETVAVTTPAQEGVLAAGEVTLPALSSFDFVTDEIDEDDFSIGDILIEYDPGTLDGCIVSLAPIIGGLYLSDTSDDLSIISAQDASGYTTGCVKPNLNGVYVYTRRELPGDYIVFRITAFDAEGITLEYIVGIYDSEDQQSTSEEGTSPDEPSEPSPSDQPLTETPLHFPAMHGFFDFDNGTSLQYAGGIVDLSLWPNEDQQLQMELNLFTEGIEPLFGIWGETEPSYIDCSTASLSTDPIPLTGGDLSLGTYICLQTSEGLFGYLRMENLLIDPEFGEQALDLAYAMWDSTGSERILPPSLHTYGNANVSDGSGKDLDFFKNSQVEDLSFQIVAEEIEVTPLSGTTLALWGTTFPSKENCESLSLGSEPIKIQKNNLQEIIDEVSYFCYQTDQGRLGRIQVNGAEEDPNTLSVFYYTDVPQVSFAYDTWE